MPKFAIVLKNNEPSGTFEVEDPDLEPKDVVIISKPEKKLKAGDTSKLEWEVTRLEESTTGILLLKTPKVGSKLGAGWYFGVKIMAGEFGPGDSKRFQVTHYPDGGELEWTPDVVHPDGDMFLLKDGDWDEYEVTIKITEREPVFTVAVDITKLLINKDGSSPEAHLRLYDDLLTGTAE